MTGFGAELRAKRKKPRTQFAASLKTGQVTCGSAAAAAAADQGQEASAAEQEGAGRLRNRSAGAKELDIVKVEDVAIATPGVEFDVILLANGGEAGWEGGGARGEAQVQSIPSVRAIQSLCASGAILNRAVAIDPEDAGLEAVHGAAEGAVPVEADAGDFDDLASFASHVKSERVRKLVQIGAGEAELVCGVPAAEATELAVSHAARRVEAVADAIKIRGGRCHAGGQVGRNIGGAVVRQIVPIVFDQDVVGRGGDAESAQCSEGEEELLHGVCELRF